MQRRGFFKAIAAGAAAAFAAKTLAKQTDEIVDARYEFAYRGPIIRYPVGTMSHREAAKHLAEQCQAGRAIVLPSVRETHGQLLWDIEFPSK